MSCQRFFILSQVNCFKYSNLTLIILLDINLLFAQRWFQVLLFNINSIYNEFFCNRNNLHRAVWFQITTFNYNPL